MQIRPKHQLELLYDLLEEQMQQLNCHIAAYGQIKRLVQSLVSQRKITQNEMLQQFPEIYAYGWHGEHVQNPKEHALTNQKNIEKWLETMGELLYSK